MGTIDMLGKKFGRLTVVARAENNKHSIARWQCVCECGKNSVVTGHNLRVGKTQSCGCLIRDLAAVRVRKYQHLAAAANTTHGHATVANTTPTYSSWEHMKERCFNPKHRNWRHYGGRGITVCERWLTFANFLADMGERPEGMTLDRYPDSDGNYEPGNCRWATAAVQFRNKKKPVGASSRFRGVSFHRKAGRWETSITVNRKKIPLGRFNNEVDAAKAYDAALLKYVGPVVPLNFPLVAA